MDHSKNTSFLDVLSGKKPSHRPIWLMRQAGRYLPLYLQKREQAGSFLALCQNPESIVEVTKIPFQYFPLDAAILFSDILTIPHAMDLGLFFKENHGPVLTRPLQDESSILALNDLEINRLNYVVEGIKLCKKELHVPLIGFCGSPFSLACYMIEGQSSQTFPVTKKMIYKRPDLFQRILAINTKAVSQHLLQQIHAGVDTVMLFDTWGGLLDQSQYTMHLDSLKAVIHSIGNQVPVILFARQQGQHLTALSGLGADALSIDFTVDLTVAHNQLPANMPIQGNLDPSLLAYASTSLIQQQTKNIIKKMNQRRHIFNLGHGILPDTPIDNVARLVDLVHNTPI